MMIDNLEVHKVRSVSFNYLMNMILTISSIIFPLLSFPYVARILNPDGIGRASFAYSIITYFSMIAQLGIPTYGVRECAKLRDNKKELTIFVKELIIINIFSCLIVYSLFFLTVVNVNRLWQDRTLLIVMCSSILFNAVGLEWLFKGLEEYAYITKRSVFFKFIAFGLMFALIKSPNDVLIYGTLLVFANIGSNICNLFKARDFVDINSVKTISLKRHLKPILIFFLLSVATTIYTNLDNVMLGFISGDSEVGYYVSATKIKAALVSVVASLGIVLLPRSSYYISKDNKDGFFKVLKESMNFTFLIAMPMAVYFSLFPDSYIMLLSGPSYTPSINVLIVLMPTVIFIGITNIYGMQMLIPTGKERVVFYSVLGGAFVDFFLNIILIPSRGAFGAAVATTIAELSVLSIQFVYNSKQFINSLMEVRFLKIVLACSISSLLACLLHLTNIHYFIKVILSFFIFFPVYIIVLIVMREPLTWSICKKIKNKIRVYEKN